MGKPAYQTDESYTYKDYITWSEGRWEIINGVLYDITPAPVTLHQQIVVELTTQLHTALRGKPCRVFCAPFDVRLPDPGQLDSLSSTVVQPDLSIVCDPSKINAKGCVGAPDFILEVLSPSTAAKDQIQKVKLYESRGVREYWILHPADGLVTIYSLDAASANARYGMPVIRKTEGVVPLTALEGLELDLSFLADPEPQADVQDAELEERL